MNEILRHCISENDIVIRPTLFLRKTIQLLLMIIAPYKFCAILLIVSEYIIIQDVFKMAKNVSSSRPKNKKKTVLEIFC